MLNTVAVDLGPRSYEVRIGTGLIDDIGNQITPRLHRRKVAVVTDETVAAELASAGLAETVMASAAIAPSPLRMKKLNMCDQFRSISTVVR